MNDDLTLDVKRAIERSAYVTSVNELERRGRRQVKVIKTSVIYDLIRQAVENARRRAGLTEEEKQRLLQASQEEFRRLLSAHTAQQRQMEEAAAERRALAERNRELEEALQAAREEAAARASEAAQLREAVSRQQAELERLRAEQPSTQALLAELRAMGETVRALEARNRELEARAASPALEALLERKLAQLTSEVSAKLHSLRIGAGDSDTSAEAIKRVIQQVFAREIEEAVESNLDAIQVKQKESGGIAANLERLRDLHRKESSQEQ